ncbi:hypothetical protein O7622_02455 [Micromonospora sp. WMMD1076]|uniref:hypothetical protein n=1 Tax=Micromonospora sp. WMMD1076 TaxID=3016103 RepID=UPI00249B1A6A|nr:hypothetical protein [Micromonospora sp. WMMD1076]WFF07484.1 hypothetical protein O7622_02455 [Micromonospora sp. WMMD1076]
MEHRYAGRALALFRQVESPDRRETERLLAELGRGPRRFPCTPTGGAAGWNA